MIEYKVNLIDLLKQHGYSQQMLQRSKLISAESLMRLKNRQPVSMATLSTVCILCGVQPGDILESKETMEELERYQPYLRSTIKK